MVLADKIALVDDALCEFFFAIVLSDKPLFLCNNSTPVIQDESIRHREETSLDSAESSK